jgi:hypothetical protein
MSNITAEELNGITRAAYDTGKALWTAAEQARKHDNIALADRLGEARAILNQAVFDLWNSNAAVLLDPGHIHAIRTELDKAVHSARAAAKNLGAVAAALNDLNQVINQILDTIKFLKSF